MRTYDLVLTAGQDVTIDIDYKFFLVLNDGGYPFDVTLYKGSISQKCQGVAAGFGLRLAAESRGKKFIFNSANTQTIKVFVGDDEAIYQRLSGSVTVNGGTLSSIAAVTAILNTVNVNIAGRDWGASYKSTTALAANTAEVVFSPASNVNGARIIACGFFSYSETNLTSMTAICKGSTPANVNDGVPIVIGDSSASSYQSLAGHLNQPQYIRPGLGLYFIGSLAENRGQRFCLYELL